MIVSDFENRDSNTQRNGRTERNSASMKDLAKKREERGETSPEEDRAFERHDDGRLIACLRDNAPKTRTSAAKILGKRSSVEAAGPLCRALEVEKKLYPRLAFCEALAAIGKPAVQPLVDRLGEIGRNHETALPTKGFYKNSYPLPRDIAARTLTLIGEPALPALLQSLDAKKRLAAEQAMDAIGHISRYSGNGSALPRLLHILEKKGLDERTHWKVIRTFQAFDDERVVRILSDNLRHHPTPAIRWEAARSLGIIGGARSIAALERAQADGNSEVRKMVAMAKGW